MNSKLNARTRYVKYCLFESVDRPPYIETHGFWPQTVERWHGEGLPAHVRHRYDLAAFALGDITVEEYFQQEVYYWPECIGSAATTPFWPPLAKEVLQEDENYIIFRDEMGIVKRDVKKGRSMPQFLGFPVKSRTDWEALKPRLDPTIEERYDATRQAVAAGFNKRAELICLPVCGAYGLPRNLLGEESLAYMYYDDPDLIRDIMETWLAYHVESSRRFSRLAEFDFVYLWEDLAFKTGPLVSPALAKEFIFPYYRDLLQELKRQGHKLLSLDCDGNPKVLMDLFVDTGVNNFMPCEIAAGMEPQWISDRYKKRCSMQGGIDKRQLTRGRKEVEAEVMRKVPQLLSRGGYIPGVDHGTPNDVPFENFCYLVELLRKLGREIKPE